jgi:hypothetical protein
VAQFEKSPVFMMASVKEAKRLDHTHLHWVIEIGGKEPAAAAGWTSR